MAEYHWIFAADAEFHLKLDIVDVYVLGIIVLINLKHPSLH